MEIASIKGDTVLLLYHPAEAAADVGQQFSLLEAPECAEGLVVQVISNDSLEYAGLQQEMIQQILEERVTLQRLLDREEGMGQIKSLKVATAKIRKRIKEGEWQAWDGWIPTRHVEIDRLNADALLDNVVPVPDCPIQAFATFDEVPIQFDGPRLNMVNVIAGVKGSGKSHLAKHLVIALASACIPCVVFDMNGEYIDLPNTQKLEWGKSYLIDLAEAGPQMLTSMVRSINKLTEGSPSEATFENRLLNIFSTRRKYCSDRKIPFTIDIAFLRTQTWAFGEDKAATSINNAIDMRLNQIEDKNVFRVSTTTNDRNTSTSSLPALYNKACQGQALVFDMRELSANDQKALVRSVNQSLEAICKKETKLGTGRYPFVFFEEAHFYVSEESIINIITRGRHIGMGSVFVTNTPQKLPDTVFRPLDNLFLLSLTHKDDIRNTSKNSFTDEATIESFATRMPKHHALVVGNVTERYPLVVRVDRLPHNVPETGRTRSTWDRFAESSLETPPEDNPNEIFDELDDPFAED